jgi:hypothetical protein
MHFSIKCQIPFGYLATKKFEANREAAGAFSGVGAKEGYGVGRFRNPSQNSRRGIAQERQNVFLM